MPLVRIYAGAISDARSYRDSWRNLAYFLLNRVS